MWKRRRFKSDKSLEECLGEEAKQLRNEASVLPQGLKRDHVLRQARQAETAAHMADWMGSRGLQSPD
jgi:hypothetical protein